MEASGKHYLTCLWPGLPEMWFRGQLAALPAALTFAFAVNFLLVARFIYPEWLAPLLVRLACWAAVGVWIYCVTKSLQRLPEVVSPRSASDQPDRFAEAHIQYLRGHWVEAEALLSDCLEIESRDPPALLLLAGVYRHTNRLAAAANLLDQLERLERGDFWWLELQDERKRLKRFEAAAESNAADADDTDNAGDTPAAVDAAEPQDLGSAAEARSESGGGCETTVEPETTAVPETTSASDVASNSQASQESSGEELRTAVRGERTMQEAEADGPLRETSVPAADSLSAAATDQAFAAELAEDWPASEDSSPYRTV
ncbi:tetratricopeptide repeat protein [Roseimaritima ulvae]|uniref:Tetratricopeptide repeat protein n=1 Tax=Roseimaritima ulvae TaxID=980254 RepID=A0A5B9QZU4_9BACT|nr:tetratricopeptide repeat protein [Roseimaritima ulvae]QEG43519.1 hypothetical protein UC8_55700 [Roseimaritima ulvae]